MATRTVAAVLGGRVTARTIAAQLGGRVTAGAIAASFILGTAIIIICIGAALLTRGTTLITAALGIAGSTVAAPLFIGNACTLAAVLA